MVVLVMILKGRCHLETLVTQGAHDPSGHCGRFLPSFSSSILGLWIHASDSCLWHQYRPFPLVIMCPRSSYPEGCVFKSVSSASSFPELHPSGLYDRDVCPLICLHGISTDDMWFRYLSTSDTPKYIFEGSIPIRRTCNAIFILVNWGTVSLFVSSYMNETSSGHSILKLFSYGVVCFITRSAQCFPVRSWVCPICCLHLTLVRSDLKTSVDVKK